MKPAKTVELLVDGDNIQLRYIGQIVRCCQLFGTLTNKRVYGDWKKTPLSPYREKIIRLGIGVVQVNRVEENATDKVMKADLALLLERGETNIYILASNDGDFTPDCKRIRQTDATIIVIGRKDDVADSLRDACHLFLDVEEIDKHLTPPLIATITNPSAKASAPKLKSPTIAKATAKLPNPSSAKASAPKLKPTPITKTTTQKPTPPPAKPAVPKPKTPAPPLAKDAAPKDKLAVMLEILVQAYQQTPQNDGWVDLARLGDVLRQIDAQFNERFAAKKLSTWFKSFSDQFEVEKDRVRLR